MHTGAGQGETTFSHGALGGRPTPPNTCYIVRDGQKIRAQVHRLHQLQAGDRVVKDTGGGGGVGRPEERDPKAVWEDVFVNEFVTIEAAREVYGVVIDPQSRGIDWAQTRALRGAAEAQRGGGR
jgi:N-methylhydantoinase B